MRNPKLALRSTLHHKENEILRSYILLSNVTIFLKTLKFQKKADIENVDKI